MNNIVQLRSTAATAAVIGLHAAFAGGPVTWPAEKAVYVTTQSIPSFSFFGESLKATAPTTSQDFANEIASVFSVLAAGQEPLGPEFEAIWDANLDVLYES